MMTRVWVVLCCVASALCTATGVPWASMDVRSPIGLHHISVAAASGQHSTVTVSFTCDIEAPGEYAVLARRGGEVIEGPEIDYELKKHCSRGEVIDYQRAIDLPENCYRMLVVSLTFNDEPSDSSQGHFLRYLAFPLYVEMSDGELVKADLYEPQGKLFQESAGSWPERGDRSEQPSPGEQSSRNAPVGETENHVITVQISGRVWYYVGGFACDYGNGVPDVRVELDWDGVDDIYMTHMGVGPHAEFDYTEMDGSYYFDFSFNSDVPATELTSRILVYAQRENDGAYNGDHVGEWFPNPLPVTVSSDSICVTGVDIEVSPHDGAALRWLYRAWITAEQEFGQDLPQVRYYHRTGLPPSHPHTGFCKGYYCDCDYLPCGGVPYIYFENVLPAEIAYHEYGHNVLFRHDGCAPPTEWPHDFFEESDQGTAYVEGWAEFFRAATFMYWYNRESLSLLLIPSAGNNGASFAAHRLKNTPGHAASP